MRRVLAVLGVGFLFSVAGLSPVSAQEGTGSAQLSVTCTVADGSTAVCSLSSDQPVGDGATLGFNYADSGGEPISVTIATGGTTDFRISFSCSDSSYCYSFSFELADSTPSSVQISGATLSNTVVQPDNDQQTPTATAPVDSTQQTQDSTTDNSLGYPCPSQPTLTCADRPNENVVTVSVTSDSVTIHNSDDGSTSTHEWETSPRTREELAKIDDFNDEFTDTSTGSDDDPVPMIVVNYPTTPSDPDEFERYRRAEDAAWALGRPYMVCFPTQLVGSDGNVYEIGPEECLIVTPV